MASRIAALFANRRLHSSGSGREEKAAETVRKEKTVSIKVDFEFETNAHLGVFHRSSYSYPLTGAYKAVSKKYNKDGNIGGYHDILMKLKSDYIIGAGPILTSRKDSKIIIFDAVDMRLGDYLKYVDKHSENVDTRALVDSLTFQILTALDYLHSRSLSHGKLRYRNIYVSIDDHHFNYGDLGCATVKLCLNGHEDFYDNQLVRPHKLYKGSMRNDCKNVVKILEKVHRRLHVTLPKSWAATAEFLGRQNRIIMSQLKLSPNMWPVHVKMSYLKTVQPLWKAKRRQITESVFVWTDEFRPELSIMRMSNDLAQPYQHTPNYENTDYGFSLFGRNGLEHFDDFSPTIARSRELFMESLIKWCPDLMQVLIGVAKKLGVEGNVLREMGLIG